MPTVNIDTTDEVEAKLANLKETLNAMHRTCCSEDEGYRANGFDGYHDTEDVLVLYADGKVVRQECQYNAQHHRLHVHVQKKGTIVELLIRSSTTIGIPSWVSLPLHQHRVVGKNDHLYVTIED